MAIIYLLQTQWPLRSCYRHYGHYVLVTDTMAITYLPSTSVTADSAAAIAALCKEGEYRELSVSYNFELIALETLGPVGPKVLAFLRELGYRFTRATGDLRESTFLFQRLSVTVRRYNAVCFAGTFKGN